MVFCWTGMLPLAIGLIVLVPSILMAFDISPSPLSILVIPGIFNTRRMRYSKQSSSNPLVVNDVQDSLLANDPVMKATLESYFREAHAHDDGSETNNPHILAKRQLEQKSPVTVGFVNQLMSYYSHPLVTQERFNYFNTAEWKYFDLPLTPASRKQLTAHIGSGDNSSDVRLPGLYQFVDKSTNYCLYVGSSVNLGARVNAYLKRSSNTIKGPIGQFVRSDKLSQAKLAVLVLDKAFNHLHISAEQFFILTLNPLLNVIKVRGSGGPTVFSRDRRTAQIKLRGQPTYMYTGNRSSLVHVFNSTRDAARQLNLAVNSLNRGLANDRTVKGYYFTKTLLINVPENIVEISTLVNSLNKIGTVHPFNHNTYYYVSHTTVKGVLRMDHIANVKQYVSAVGLDVSILPKNIPNLTLDTATPVIGNLCIQLEDNGYPLGNKKYPNAIDWNPDTYINTDLSNVLPLVKNVVFKRKRA